MAEMIVLEAAKREVTGKEVRHLRREGIIPGVLYGPEFDALPLQVAWTTLRPVLLEAGGSQVIELNLGDETYNALVRNVQRSPMRGDVLHIDFYRVRMDVVIRTEVPIWIEGDTEALEAAGGVIVHEMTSIVVECLPTVLPPGITLDISGLVEVGKMITVSDLPDFPGVTYHADPDSVVVTTTYLERIEEEEEEEEEEELLGEDVEEPELIRRREEEEGEEE